MTASSPFPLPHDLKGIIFDCDGVILDSRAANERYYNLILEALDLPPLTPEQESFTFMATVHQSLEYITPPHLHCKLPEVCKKIVNYQRDIMPLLRLERGLLDFLRWLRSLDVRMAVHTNRFSGMDAVMDAFDLRPYFSPVVTAAMVKPKPDPDGALYILDQWNMPGEQALFVGDSPNDAQAALAGGISFAAYRNPALGAAVNVDSFEDLADVLRRGSLPRTSIFE